MKGGYLYSRLTTKFLKILKFHHLNINTKFILVNLISLVDTPTTRENNQLANAYAKLLGNFWRMKRGAYFNI